MNILDAIILLCLIPAVIQGLRKGFISQVTSIISIVVGVWAAANFTGVVVEWISKYFEATEQLIHLAAFAIILVAAILALALVGKLIESILKLTLLGWVNKLLGIIFSALKATLIIGLALSLINSIALISGLITPEIIETSALYEPITNIADTIFPYIKNILIVQ